jgi:hypothetical protein
VKWRAFLTLLDDVRYLSEDVLHIAALSGDCPKLLDVSHHALLECVGQLLIVDLGLQLHNVNVHRQLPLHKVP